MEVKGNFKIRGVGGKMTECGICASGDPYCGGGKAISDLDCLWRPAAFVGKFWNA